MGIGENLNFQWFGRRKKVLLSASIISLALILSNLLIVTLYRSTISFYAGYLLGKNIRSILSTLLFVEALAILGLGALWASGAMESQFDGSNIATNPYRRREQFKQRPEELDQENTAGKIMLLVGAPILLVALILIFA